MISQLSRIERIFQRIIFWSNVALGLSYVGVVWLLRGQPELLLRWLEIWTYLMAALATLQVCRVAIVVRDRGIMPAILFLIAGGTWLGFAFFPREWLLLLSISLWGAGGMLAAWPRIREQLDRMRVSYREIAQLDKT